MYYQQQLDFTTDEVIVYLRKSRSDDPSLTVEEVLERHEERLDDWAEKNLGSVFKQANKIREIVSGETLSERPEAQKMLRMIESPKWKAVAVADLQRLSRGDLEDVGRLMKLFKITDTKIITPQRVFDLRDEYDWEAVERDLKQGNYYLQYFKKISNAGRLQSVASGNFIGSVPPYGYDKTTVMDGKRKCPTLIENKEQADVVRMIFDMYVNQDMGRTSICHRLDELGIKPPKGKNWSPPALKDMLENVHYIGKVKWNWRKTVTIVEDGEIRKTNPKAKIDEYLIYDGKHAGIIPEKLFYAAREKQGRNHRAKPTTKVRNPLASILYCHCGRAMSLRTNRKNTIERGAARLMCDDQVHCNTGSVLYDEMIDRVAAILEQCIEDFEIRKETDTGDSEKLHARLIKRLEKKLVDLQAKELSQWEAQSDPDPEKRMPHEIFKQLNAKLLKEKQEIQEALCKARESAPEHIDYEEQGKRFKDALAALRDPAVDAREKNRLLKLCIDRIEYKRDKPERLRRAPGEKKGTTLSVGGGWTSPPIELDVKLKV